jgi:thiol-disulfide isomerase/thioredoxin
MRTVRLLAAVCLLSLTTTATAADLPRQAPDLSISLAPNKAIRLSEYRGKTVVLAFILTYCSHCQAVMRGLVKDQAELGPKGLRVVACAIEDVAATAVPGFIRQFAPNFPVGYGLNTDALRFLQHPIHLGFYMPAVVFIDKTGVIRAQYEGRDDMLKEATQEKTVREKILEVMELPAAAPVKSAPAKKAKGKKS